MSRSFSCFWIWKQNTQQSFLLFLCFLFFVVVAAHCCIVELFVATFTYSPAQILCRVEQSVAVYK